MMDFGIFHMNKARDHETIIFHWPAPVMITPVTGSGMLRTWRMMLEVKSRGYFVVLVVPKIDTFYTSFLRGKGIEVCQISQPNYSEIKKLVNIQSAITRFQYQESTKELSAVIETLSPNYIDDELEGTVRDVFRVSSSSKKTFKQDFRNIRKKIDEVDGNNK